MSEKKMGAPLRFPALTGDPIRDRIIKLRRRLGISQAALAKRLGVTRMSVHYWENGLRPPSAPILILIGMIEEIEQFLQMEKEEIELRGADDYEWVEVFAPELEPKKQKED